jgi:glyoxylase-like metal-dependent hydrolase (beta-lactamase superfamily II)
MLHRNTPVCIGSKVKEVQNRFAPLYGFEIKDFDDVFDVLLLDDDRFKLGELEGRSLSLPGHTPDSMGIVIGDSLFAGDSIFL